MRAYFFINRFYNKQRDEKLIAGGSRGDNSDTSCTIPHLDPQSISLRFLCPSDIEIIRILCQDWFPIEYPLEWYEQIVTPRYYSLVAQVDACIVGLIVCEIKSFGKLNKEDRDILPASMSDCDVGYILSLGVHKKYRRKGIGSLLLDTFISHITSSDRPIKVKAVYLHVLTTNQAAIVFYESRNFKYHSFLPYYYSIRGRSRDAFLYVNYINGGRRPNVLDQIKQTIVEIFCRPLIWIINRLRYNRSEPRFKFAQI